MVLVKNTKIVTEKINFTKIIFKYRIKVYIFKDFMPKFYSIKNNYGISLIPVLVLSLVVGIGALLSYKFYSSNNVLQMQSKSNSTPSESNELEVSIEYVQRGSIMNTGVVTYNIKGNVEKLIEINQNLQKTGAYISTSDLCFTVLSKCNFELKNLKRKTTLLVNEKLLKVEFPVTFLTQMVLFNPYFQVNSVNKPKFKILNSLDGWDVVMLKDNEYFRLLRQNEKPLVKVELKSLNNNTGQQNLEVRIDGVGNEVAGLIRAINTKGIKRIDISGAKEITSIVRPVVNYKGREGIFALSSLKNTKSFILPNSSSSPTNEEGDISRYDFSNNLGGWSVNKDSNGIEREISKLPSRIQITQLPSKTINSFVFNFVINGSSTDLEKISNTVKNKGLTVTSCMGEKSCFYPVQKPNIVCNNLGCRFSIEVPKDAGYIYFNYEGDAVFSVFEKLPAGWVTETTGQGIRKS